MVFIFYLTTMIKTQFIFFKIYKMLTTVIIDDDEIATFVLVNLLKKLLSFEIQIAGTASNLLDGVELIKKTQPDLVILEINMPGKNGLEIFNEFKHLFFKIIFCTAYKQYAIDVLRRNAQCGYLLKPIDIYELNQALQKVSNELIEEQKHLQIEDKINIISNPLTSGENILLEIENGFIIGNTRNIEYCYAKDSHSVVVMHSQKEFFVTKSLKELQGLLPEKQFYRTHKSFLANIYYINKFVCANENYVLMESGDKIPVSVRVSSNISKDIIKKMKSV